MAELVPVFNAQLVKSDVEYTKRLREWVGQIQNISPLVLVKSVLSEKFTTEHLIKELKLYLASGDSNIPIEIKNLYPEEICFFTAIDVSVAEQKVQYDFSDMHIFCTNNKAFSVVHAERV